MTYCTEKWLTAKNCVMPLIGCAARHNLCFLNTAYMSYYCKMDLVGLKPNP